MAKTMDIFAKLKMNFKRAKTFIYKKDINSIKAGLGYMENVTEKIEKLIQQIEADVFFDERFKELVDKVPLFYYEVVIKEKEISKITKKKRDRDFHFCQNSNCPNDVKMLNNKGVRKLYIKKDMYKDPKTKLMFCNKDCYKILFEDE